MRSISTTPRAQYCTRAGREQASKERFKNLTNLRRIRPFGPELGLCVMPTSGSRVPRTQFCSLCLICGRVVVVDPFLLNA